MKILLRFWQKGQKQPKIRYGTNPAVLSKVIAWANFQKAYLKVTYGKDVDVFGRRQEFYNDGFYENKNELKKAFRAFIEK